MQRIDWLDYFKIQLDQKTIDRIQGRMNLVIDSLLQSAGKGLILDIDTSASAKLINNRIYSPWGQRDGVIAYTDPYQLPVIYNHNTDTDPMGRVLGGTWTDTSQNVTALGDAKLVRLYQEAFTAQDTKKLIDWAHAADIARKPQWAGTGLMRAQLRITDSASMEKFLDGRYQTFSQGADTDHAYCSVCQSDWRAMDICDHRPGQVFEDQVAFLALDKYVPNEISVATIPAFKEAQVRAIRVQDQEIQTRLDEIGTQVDPVSVMVSGYNLDSQVVEPPEVMVAEPEAAVVAPTETPVEDEMKTQLAALAASLATLNDRLAALEKPAEVEIPVEAPALVVDKSVELQTALDALQTKHAGLTQDYAASLARIEQIQDVLVKISQSFKTKTGQEFDVLDNDSLVRFSESVLDFLQSPKTLDDPSVAGSSPVVKPKKDQLGKWEQKIVDSYRMIKTKDGEKAAEQFWLGQMRYAPPKFHPRDHI